eukprot:GSChrysophyteH1.ASY1.ANO1.1978.1 assembled CDS
MADFADEMSNNENTQNSQVNNAQEFSTDLLRLYYSRLFPADEMFNWLAYGNDANFFNRREWSFTIEDDIYIRYQCFKDKNEMLAAIQKRQPHKIDIGAVFSAHPDEHNSIDPSRFKTVERELVFDIDMTDYDDVRNCCKGANICSKCWPFMTMALKCVNIALKEDFGFRNILWVYSGRRGVHCWVGDAEARALTNEARSAVVEYLSLELEGKGDKLKRQVSSPLHPHLKRSYELLETYFESFICGSEGQGIFTNENRNTYVTILNTIPDNILKEAISPVNGAKKRKIDMREMETWKYMLVFKYTYPRLDANVSKMQNHLLKSPFCVHPKTGRVCIPIDPATAESFNPFTVPTVRSLCEQIDEYDAKNPSKAGITSDINKTDMRQAIDVFNRSFMDGMWRDIKREWRSLLEENSAINVDF